MASRMRDGDEEEDEDVDLRGGGGAGGGADDDDDDLLQLVGSSSSRQRAAAESRVAHEQRVASFMPFVEKYRPEKLEDLTGQGDIVQTITRLIDAGRLPHLLFYGPPGTGKTSTILAMARKLYGSNSHQMVLELNASDDRGIDVVRDQIKDFASTRKLFSSGVKLIILDEADAMTNDAQFALRRVIEKFTKNTRFCLIGNYVSKIIPALQSRCTKFRFAPLKKEQIEGKLRSIIDREGLAARVTDDGVESILRLAGGDMRKVLNVLQATASGFETVSCETVHACTGQPLPSDIAAILRSLMNDDFEQAAGTLLAASHSKGLSLVDIVTELSRTVAQLKLPDDVRVLLVDRLSDIEYRLSFGTNDKIQCAALVGAFALAREAFKAFKSKQGGK